LVEKRGCGGTHSDGKRIRAGYYILEAVFRHSSGKSFQVKKTLPVGGIYNKIIRFYVYLEHND
ncbi:hypothetical protein A3SI_18181, partial [Nitritalea halalkaliphila LW7]